MNNTIEQSRAADQASVSRLAYQLWESAGRPDGRDLEFWLAAEAKVRSGASRMAATTQAAALAQSQENGRKTARPGTRKTWPKPYPNLPKF